MSRPLRTTGFRRLASSSAPLVVLLFSLGCRKMLAGGERASMSDIEANLEELIGIAQAGLNLQVSPRFLTFGPLPSSAPWETPVRGDQAFEAQGRQVKLKTGRDGLVHERYEARACPLREIWSCVELWATGRFGRDAALTCVGLRLEKGITIEKKQLDRRKAENCPFMTSGPGPAQQIVRGIEKAQLEHARRQETDRYLDPKSE